MKLRIVGLAVVSAVLFVPAALGITRVAARPNTTVPDVFLPIHITITDTRITLDRKSANRGDEVRFTIRNAGTKMHNFTLGNKVKRGVGQQVGFSATLKPKTEKLYLLFMDYRGPLPYRSVLKADRTKPGMRGTFHIR